MVKATADEILSRRLKQAEVVLMDGEHPDFPEKSFDYILCGFALHFLDYPIALPRFRQLLRPGGTIATVGPFIPTDDRDDVDRWQWLFQLTREVFPPDFIPPSSWTSPHRLNTPELITHALREAGFIEILTWRAEKVMYFADEEDWWAWEWSQASRFWLEGMSPEGLAKFKAVSYEKLSRMKEVQGIPMRWGAQFASGKTLERV
jgi:O-methyltransferase/aklanonic acid methyltransferase